MAETSRVVDQLRDALRATRADLDRLTARADEFLHALGDRPPSDIEIFGAGAVLHGYYNTVERWMATVARELNAGPPEGSDWHRLLLRSMAMDKPGHRPALFDEELVSELGAYMRFRHLFRHLYVLDLRWDEIRALLVVLVPLHRRIDERLAAFEAFLVGLERQPRA